MSEKKTTPIPDEGTILDSLQKENAQIKEQLAVMQAEHEQLKSLVGKTVPEKEAKAAAAKPEIPAKAEFTHADKKYKVLLPHVTIPGIGYRTAAEILLDEKAQAALVATGSGAIKEVL